MTWIRKGECTNCGFCCRAIAVVELDFPNLLDDLDFLKVRGISPTGKKTLPVIDPCPKLHTNHDGTTKCGIYPTRPKTCRDFPAEPEHVISTPCTYWFENDETGEIISGTPNTNS